jgi:P4 family phage/plasmid primase-like protien
MSVEFNDFLNKYKIETGKGLPYTHTSMGRPAGSYNIPVSEKPQLLDLIYQTSFVNKCNVHLTEKPPQETNIRIDIDFKFPIETTTRQYTIKTIQDLVSLYHKAITHFIDIDEKKHTQDLRAYVFERDAPYNSNGNMKDGIHIIYPYVICDTRIQHLIREHVLANGISLLKNLNSKNCPEDIVDKAVISTNNWLMYGCSKPNTKPYKLTHIYDYECNDLNLKNHSIDNRQLLELLSIRDHDPTMYKPIKEVHQVLLESKKKQIKPRRLDIVRSSHGPTQIGTYNLDEIRELVDILSVDRADMYPTWMEVGFCLHNINNMLLECWIDFSKKSAKFKDGECEKLWYEIDAKNDGLGMGSLHRWARLDNETAYKKIMSASVRNDILKSQSMTTQDVARVVFNMYKHQYKCTSTRHNIWYEFSHHRWVKDEQGISLKKRIGNEVLSEYLTLINYYNSEAASNTDEDAKENSLNRAKILSDVTYKLRDITFKEKIMKECQMMFSDGKFEESLDSNPDMIGFENGVYDLKNKQFRDGRPEDFISLTTGNDYVDYSDREDDEHINTIFVFLAQVFPDKAVREYALTLLASFLEGRNPNEKFHIWTGVGGNGKSKLMELFEAAFGKYTQKMPITLLTQKTRANSSSANPEVAALKGSRVVTAQEPEENEKFNVGILKEWTGGDKITCRALYKEPITFKPQFKMVVSCNHLPALPPDDEGTWRRISVIQFNSKFVDNPDPDNPNEFPRDYHIAEKLNLCREAFMYILIKYYNEVYSVNKKLIEPKVVKDATKNYRDNFDTYKDFMAECIHPDVTGTIKLEETFKLFKDWWKENRPSKPPSRKDMKACLEKKIGKYAVGSKSGWKGHKLVYPSQENDDEDDVKEIEITTSNTK